VRLYVKLFLILLLGVALQHYNVPLRLARETSRCFFTLRCQAASLSGDVAWTNDLVAERAEDRARSFVQLGTQLRCAKSEAESREVLRCFQEDDD
jgi:hypothetical protein